MIVDAFMYRDEPDCLDIRLHELSRFVELTVVVEGDHTFQGNPKPLLFDFDRWADIYPIEHVVVTDWPDSTDPWAWEAHQREAVLQGLDGVPDDALVLWGDADEIPNPDVIPEAERLIRDVCPQVSLEQQLAFYHVNNVASEAWYGTQALSAGRLRANGGERSRRDRTANAIVRNGGWHWSNLGDPAWIVEKIEAFSHSEVNLPEYKDPVFLEACIRAGSEMTGRSDLNFTRLDPDDMDLPAYLLENRDRFSHLFADVKALA